MLKSIELNSHIRNRLAEYLKGRGMDFQTAMQEEKRQQRNRRHRPQRFAHSGPQTVFRTKNAEVFLGKAGFDCRLHQPPDAGIGG